MNLFVFHLKHCRLLLQFTLLFCHDFIQILGIIWQYKICRTKNTCRYILQVFLQHANNLCFWYKQGHIIYKITYLKPNIKHPSICK